jgi:hypothetical protein
VFFTASTPRKVFAFGFGMALGFSAVGIMTRAPGP